MWARKKFLEADRCREPAARAKSERWQAVGVGPHGKLIKEAIMRFLLRFALCSSILLFWQTSTPRAQDRGPAGTVTMTRTDYDRLLELASKQPRPPDAAPLAAALTRADIRVRVASGTVRASMTVEGEVFQTGAVKVPLISNATLLDARMADRPLPLLSEGNAHVAILTGPGPFSATLDWGTALTATPGRGSFVLPVPPSGSATATFDVPGEQSDLRVSPGLVLRRTSKGGRTEIEAALDPGSATQVWWSSRETTQSTPPRDLRLLADIKTLVTIGDADLRLLTLIDVTVVQGEPSEIEVRLPSGYELAGVTGASLERSEERGGRLVLFVANPSRRRHQFLINLERATSGGSIKVETGFPTLPVAQRETGEIAVEGVGTLEISSTDIPGLRRMDVREVDAALTSVGRQSLLAAYRYQRGPVGPPTLALNVTRFPDAAVLAAIAERAEATTLVTSEGRALTEVSLWLRNRAQPFMKVALPAGASLLSVEVAGSPAKPVEGTDGMRVPLLRPGFRPDGLYKVSFVYLHTGTPFAKKGDMQMTLPKMDLPVGVVEWELFVPKGYRADRFDGSAIAAELVQVTATGSEGAMTSSSTIRSGIAGGAAGRGGGRGPIPNGTIRGQVNDSAGNVVPGASVTAEVAGQKRTVITDANGWYQFSNLPSGQVTITSQLQGFKTSQQQFVNDQVGREFDFAMQTGQVSETVTVNSNTTTRDNVIRRELRVQELAQAEPSANVQSLQRRAAGVLPIRMEVPRAGTSHRFVKPLVIDEETMVSFRYKRR
jgi:Carboxypeptidase regulatory-like domain